MKIKVNIWYKIFVRTPETNNNKKDIMDSLNKYKKHSASVNWILQFSRCSDVRDRHRALQQFCFCHHFNMIILHLLGPFNSYWDYFPENKREAILLKNTCILYNFSVPGFLLETWVIWPQTGSMLEALWGTKTAESALLSPSSEDPSLDCCSVDCLFSLAMEG